MDKATVIFIFFNRGIPVFILFPTVVYLVYKIYKKLIKKTPFIVITRKTDLHKDIKNHIKKHHKKYEITSCILIPLYLVFCYWICIDFILDFPKLIFKKYETLNCIALNDNKIFSGGRYSFSEAYVDCNCDGEILEIAYFPSNQIVKKGEKIKVNYLRNLEIGTIIE